MPSSPRIAVFAGTFDPMTLGHENLLLRACSLFDRIVVGVAAAYHKKTLFDLPERLALVRTACAHLPQVQAVPLHGLLMDFAKEQRAVALIRGVRGAVDFDYEAQLAGMNRRLAPSIETVLLTPSDDTLHISSTLVREIARLGGAFEQFVSPSVAAQMALKIATLNVD